MSIAREDYPEINTPVLLVKYLMNITGNKKAEERKIRETLEIAEPLMAMWENAALSANVLEVANNVVEMVEAVDDCKEKLEKVLKTVRKIDEAIKMEPVL